MTLKRIANDRLRGLAPEMTLPGMCSTWNTLLFWMFFWELLYNLRNLKKPSKRKKDNESSGIKKPLLLLRLGAI